MAPLIHSSDVSTLPKTFSNTLNPSLRKLRGFATLLKEDAVGPKARISVPRGRSNGVRVSDSYQSGGSYPSPVKKGTRPSKEEEEKQNYYVNMGHAIRTLREEFPEIFYRELSVDIYRDDIVFKDPINTFVGIENYKSIFQALRFLGQLFFKALWIDLISMSQPVENIIMVRWTVHGIPRVFWESRGRFDGTSEYKLDKAGKIYEHRVDNIALNSPPKFQVLAVEDLIRTLGCPSSPRPTYFKVSSFSTSSCRR